MGSTTHISVIDSEGNAASVTTSHGEGSSYVIPGTVLWSIICLEGRFKSTWIPSVARKYAYFINDGTTIVLKIISQKLFWVLEGNRIRTAILQVISNIVDFKMHVDVAVSPRSLGK